MKTRRSDTPEFARIIECDLAKANADLAALAVSISALTMENANLRHQNYAQAQELVKLRKLHATAIGGALMKECHEG